MKTNILFLFTRTPLHIGAGASVGAIDQPIVRERHTGYPVIPGSSLKGVLRDACNRGNQAAQADALFGTQTDAGKVSFGEGRLLAFPVRSAKGAFAFVTSRLALERFRRDRDGLTGLPELPTLPDMECLAGETVTVSNNQHKGVVLEEYRFNPKDVFPVAWENALQALLDDPVWQAGKSRFVMLSDGDFAHFVKSTCEISQHVGINPETGTAKKGALFNLEAVPAETLFYAPMVSLARESGEFETLKKMLEQQPLLQVGADSTTGLGFCTVKLG